MIVKTLARKDRWSERGIKNAIYVKVECTLQNSSYSLEGKNQHLSHAQHLMEKMVFALHSQVEVAGLVNGNWLDSN